MIPLQPIKCHIVFVCICWLITAPGAVLLNAAYAEFSGFAKPVKAFEQGLNKSTTPNLHNQTDEADLTKGPTKLHEDINKSSSAVPGEIFYANFTEASPQDDSANLTVQSVELAPVLVDQYTDCAKQTPPVSPAAEADWWKSQGGKHWPPHSQVNAKDDGPIRVPGEPLGVCVMPKNGCTYWKALLMRMSGNAKWNSKLESDRHFNNGLHHDSRVLEQRSGQLTAMLVRNPMSRVLSAWKEKSTDKMGYYKKWFDKRPAARKSFRSFIRVIWSDVANSKGGPDLPDPHWRRQVDQCLLQDGAAYDINLKVECRGNWGPSLFRTFRSMLPFTKSGWGFNAKQPFIAPTERAAGAKPAQPTKLRGQASSHTTNASKVVALCNHYDDALFKKVAWLYRTDIKRLGYTADVRRLAQLCGFSQPL